MSEPERDPFDKRVLCVECRHFRPWQCGNYRMAQLDRPVIGPALAQTPQRCNGYEAKA
jgi:hypothetical protein